MVKGILLSMNGTMRVSDLIIYVGSISLLFPQLVVLIDKFFEFEKLTTEYLQYQEFCSYYKTGIQDNASGTLLSEPIQQISLMNVSYHIAERTVLDNISLTVTRGEKLALIGENGAGKSTLYNLILGFIKPSSGQVLVNERLVDDYIDHDYLQHFSVMFQSEYVTQYTVRDYIVNGLSFNSEHYQAVLQRSGVIEFINDLPQQDDTIIVKQLDASGVSLSGGQLQKLNFAQALYRDGEVFLLDEPTSALDPLNEKILLEDYMQILKDKIVILTSHRVSSARFCDKVVFIKEGQIKEYGTHDELIALGGEYYELYTAQAQFYQ